MVTLGPKVYPESKQLVVTMVTTDGDHGNNGRYYDLFCFYNKNLNLFE